MSAQVLLRSYLLLTFLSTFTLSLAAAEPVGHSDKAVSEMQMKAARAHFANGVELLNGDQANYQDAYHQFQLAYAKTLGSWKVAGNLGLCALKLERDGEARRFYTIYLKEGKDEVDPEERATIERELLLIEGSLVTLELNFPEPGARVIVKRTGSLVAPQIYESASQQLILGVRAGELEVTATLADKKEVHSFRASPQDSLNYEFFSLEEPLPMKKAPVQELERSHSLRTIGWITAGVGAAALSGGLVTGLLYQRKKQDGEAECINGVCPTSAESIFKSADQLGLMTNILLISGATLAVTGVSLVVVDATRGPKLEEEQPLATSRKGIEYFALQPLLHPRIFGVSASGKF